MKKEIINTPLVQVDIQKGQPKLVSKLNDPKDVAEQMLYIGSEYSSFINGSILVIDSGMNVTSNGYK